MDDQGVFARPRTDPWPEELDLPAPDPYEGFETDHDLRLLFGDLPDSRSKSKVGSIWS